MINRCYSLVLILGFMLAPVTVFSSERYAQFWSWFLANENRLYEFEADQEELFDDLASRLNAVDSNLTFEFGPPEDGVREFVISAAGIKDAFPEVEALHAAAPSLERWRVTKFRPRRSPINDIEIGGKTIRARDVRYCLFKDGDKLGIILMIDGYNEAQEFLFKNFAYLFLDEAIGEFDVETKMGFIIVESHESKYFERSSPITELAAHFDSSFSALRN